ncbi:hypothetical protein HC031_30215, partial [Planosporangium thailandense]|nr:hypothetical protein [Planosporangium thailandense]
MDEALAVLDRAVVRCRSASVWAWSDAELVDSLDYMHTLIQQLTAFQLRLVREV